MTFIHTHPYPPYIPEQAEKLIVGTLPPPRFTTGELLEKDVDFCYGSYYNSLWLYIDKIHQLNLRYDNSEEAIEQRKQFLIDHKIGICDIVESAERDKIDASDLGMNNIILRDLLYYLRNYPTITTILCMGGNSKNGPEFHFRKQLKNANIKLTLVSNIVPKVHSFTIDDSQGSPRTISTISLTSASGSANRAIGSMAAYQELKRKDPNFNTFDFRVLQYRDFL